MILIFITLYVSLIGFFLPKEIYSEKSILRVAFLKATLFLSFLIYIHTELLSFFSKIEFFASTILWLLSTIIATFLAWRNSPKFLIIIYERIVHFFKRKEYLLYFILLACVPLLFLVLYIPTTNNDSLNYHVSRVIYWIYNKDVDFFPTLNGRQLFYSPFAEYAILQLQLVTQKIWYSNIPQFVSMLGTLVTVSLISEKIYNNRTARNIAVFLMFTLPIGLFESTTTQNDYVVTFFTIVSVYFLMETYTHLKWSNVIFFAIALGISGLTKYSGWVFATPFYLLFAILLLKKYRISILKFLPVSFILFSLILAPFIYRNIDTFQSPLGLKIGGELYYDVMNEKILPINTISATIKNIGTAAATPIPIINKVIKKSVQISNQILGKDIDNKNDNFLGLPYSNSFSFHEDRASNFIHFWLFLFSVIPLFFVKSRKTNLIYFALLWSSWILFSTLFKWQPWHSRMELIWFALLMPFLGYLYSEFLKINWLRYSLMGLLSIYAILIITLNPSKQLIPLTNLSGMMPSFFSEYDLQILEDKEVYKERVLDNTSPLKEYGLSFYLPKESTDYTETEKKEILKHLDFPLNGNIYQKTYAERMMPLDMTIYHQMKNMMKYIDKPQANIGLSLLAGTREFLVLYPLSNHPNVNAIKNVAYPSILSNTPHTDEEYKYDYLLTNNFLIFDQLDLSNVEKVYDFAYFKLYKFHKPQTRKYQVKDILQNFTI